MNPLPPTLGSGLESGDLNGDGIDDLVMAGEFLNENDDPNVTIFYTLGNGEFEEFELSVALTNASFEIFDADGDGDNDLVAAGRDDWEPYTRLFLNDGNGNFQSPSNSAEFIPIYFGNIESWDVDGDGDLDLLIGGDGENLPSVARIYFNDGNGGFEISNSLALYTSNSGNVIRDIRFVDIDADQDQDVLMSFNFGAPQVFLNNGLGEFDEQEIDFQFDFLGSDFFGIADFNDDGFPDLIGNRRIHFNQGDYIFEESEFELSLFPEENFSESTYRKRFFPGDFDADGDIDLVLCGTIELEDSLHNDALRSYTRLYENSGQGNFQLVEDAGIRGFSECAIVSGNFVGDENEDLIFVGSNHYLSPDCEIYEGLGDLHFDPYDRFPFTFVRNSRTVQEDFNGDGIQPGRCDAAL
ncbi:MAG: VCBS repeat-containing protein, partial [Bacteroidota bacterium]